MPHSLTLRIKSYYYQIKPSDLQDAYHLENSQRTNNVKERRVSIIPNSVESVKTAIRGEFADGYVEFGGLMGSVSDAHFICFSNVLSVIAWVKTYKNLDITKEHVTVSHATIRCETEGFLHVPLPTKYLGFAGWKPENQK